MVVAALVNPAFNHEGATILTYLPPGSTPDAGEYPVWSGGSGHAGGGCHMVFLLYGGHDLGQVRVPIRARYSGPLSRPEYDAALCTKIPSAASGRIRGPTVYWPGCL